MYRPDLPGHGDRHNLAKGATLEAYVRCILETLAGVSEPAVLVGHGTAATPVAEAADLAPQLVKRLTFVSGIIPSPGSSVMARMQENPANALRGNIRVINGQLQLRDQIITTALYHDCSQEQIEFAETRLVPEPIKPLNTPVKLDRGGFENTPKSYIECVEDQTIHISLQRRIAEEFLCNPVLTLHTGHSPFFSAPATLAAAIAATGIERESKPA